MNAPQVVILVGGKGTRLSALYPDRPKALAPVAGRAFIEWQLDWLHRGGIACAHLAAGHMADVLEKWVADHTPEGMTLTISREPRPLGTAGGLKYVEPWLQGDTFLALNGDSVLPNLVFQSLEKTDESFPIIGKNGEKFSNHWKNPGGIFQSLEKSVLGVVVVAPIEEAGRYGTVEFDAQDNLLAFREKAQQAAGWINAGIYLLRREFLALIPPEQDLSLEKDIFPELARQRRIKVFRAPPPLLDMGTPEGLEAMAQFFTQPDRV